MNNKAQPTYRFIPKRVYQATAVFLLLNCFTLTIIVVWQEQRPFTTLHHWLGEDRWGLAAFLTFLVLFGGWIVVVLPLRFFSQMPRYHEELQAAGATDFKELYHQQQTKLFLNHTGPLTPAQQAIRARSLALGGLVLGFIAGVATAVLFLISDIIWISGIIFALLGIILGGWQSLKSLWLSRRP
ncbi:MAG: hypothetical protein H6658_04290 [Ardenticatenaceae bacterium]|nr:hypothetical protein [Ardenticatenaceae bacterium]